MNISVFADSCKSNKTDSSFIFTYTHMKHFKAAEYKQTIQILRYYFISFILLVFFAVLPNKWDSINSKDRNCPIAVLRFLNIGCYHWYIIWMDFKWSRCNSINKSKYINWRKTNNFKLQQFVLQFGVIKQFSL